MYTGKSHVLEGDQLMHIEGDRLMHILTLVGAVGSIASVVALFIAFYQIRQGIRQTELANKTVGSLSGQAEQLSNIVGSLSTRFLGVFPDPRYLSEAAVLISSAEKSIKIMALVPSHGDYSIPDSWLRVRHAIEAKIHEKRDEIAANKFKAILLCGTESSMRKNYVVQHRDLEDRANWESWKAVEVEAKRLDRWIQEYWDTDFVISNLSQPAYIDMRTQHDLEVVKDVYKQFRTFQCTEILPLFCWIVDGAQAVFSIKTEDSRGHYKGAGFLTSDQHLVETLDNVFEHYRALPHTPPVGGGRKAAAS